MTKKRPWSAKRYKRNRDNLCMVWNDIFNDNPKYKYINKELFSLIIKRHYSQDQDIIQYFLRKHPEHLELFI